MNQLIQFSYLDDFYEITIRGTLIISIVKYCGGSQYRRELAFDACTEAVQLKIIQKIRKLYE